MSRVTARAFYGTRPTLREAQELAVEPILAGEDTLVIAGTGSGKTEAVVAPVVDRYLAAALSDEQRVTFLYISPTKALANDIASRLAVPLDSLHVRVGRRHGDRNDLDRKLCPHFVITTPESLDIELVRQRERYRGVRAVVLDEVHQLAGTQRGLQLSLLLVRLERWLSRPLQVLGMSATLANPGAAWEALRPGRTCRLVHTESRRDRSFVLRKESSETGLTDLLSRTASKGKVLVFARSRGETEAIAAGLGETSAFGRRVYTHHSSLDVAEREHVERDLKSADATLCVATSTLELGIDIGDINLVVLVGAPPDWRSLEQRIGRTNRRSNRTDVLGVVPPTVEHPLLELALFLGLIAQSDGQLARQERAPRLLGAVAQQAVSIVRQGADWVEEQELRSTLSQAHEVTSDDVAAILEELVEAGLLRRHPVLKRLGAGPELGKVVEAGAAWGNFPASSQALNLFADGRRLGEVPMSPHNLGLLKPGKLVAFRGRTLVVERLVRGREVHLRPSPGRPTDKLRFGGNAPVRDPYLIGALPEVLLDRDLPQHLGRKARAWWDEAAPHVSSALMAGSTPCWRTSSGVAHATFAGLWVNQVLLALHKGQGSAGEVVVHLPGELRPSELPGFEELDALALENSPGATGLSVWQHLLPSQLLAEEVLQPWRTDPVYRTVWNRVRGQRTHWAADGRLSAFG